MTHLTQEVINEDQNHVTARAYSQASGKDISDDTKKNNTNRTNIESPPAAASPGQQSLPWPSHTGPLQLASHPAHTLAITISLQNNSSRSEMTSVCHEKKRSLILMHTAGSLCDRRLHSCSLRLHSAQVLLWHGLRPTLVQIQKQQQARFR